MAKATIKIKSTQNKSKQIKTNSGKTQLAAIYSLLISNILNQHEYPLNLFARCLHSKKTTLLTVFFTDPLPQSQISPKISDMETQPPLPQPPPPYIKHEDPQPNSPASDIWWPSLKTSSNILIWATPPLPNYWNMVAKVHTVGKRAVRILLEMISCF